MDVFDEMICSLVSVVIGVSLFLVSFERYFSVIISEVSSVCFGLRIRRSSISLISGCVEVSLLRVIVISVG